MNTKTPTTDKFTLDPRQSIQQWKETCRQTLPLLKKVYQKAVSGVVSAFAAPEDLDKAIWQQLPKRITTLGKYAAVAARYAGGKNAIFEKLRWLALLKIASKLTAPNRWHLSWDAWKIGQELQQLWPLWKAGLVWEFRWSFDASLSAAQISKQMTLIRDNILSDPGFRVVYVVARHRRAIGDPEDYTDWHVHGMIWMKSGLSIKPAKLTYWITKLKLALRGGKKAGAYRYSLRETHWGRVKGLPEFAVYMAGNYNAAVNFREKVRQAAKGKALPVSVDAGEGVRLYCPPREAWIHQGRVVRWERLRVCGKTTPHAQAYRKACTEKALSLGFAAADEIKFSKQERASIFSRSFELMEDLPELATVRGRDGHLYRVIPGNAVWWETQFFYLVRKETPEDYFFRGLPVPGVLEAVWFPVTIYQLFRLGQVEIAPYAMPSKTKQECPLTGDRPKPKSELRGLVKYIGEAMVADVRAESKWLGNAGRHRVFQGSGKHP